MTCNHKDAFVLDGETICLDCTPVCSHPRRVIVSLDPFDSHLVEECAECRHRFEPERQPPPKPPVDPNAKAVLDLLAADLDHLGLDPDTRAMIKFDIAARDAAGQKTYGTRLFPGNGRDALVDAYEESLDLAAYLRQHGAEGGFSLRSNDLYYKALTLMIGIRKMLSERDGK